MECEHRQWVSGWYSEEVNFWTGGMEDIWNEGYWESSQEDIDTHRFKCSLCGEIGYYSGVAKEHFEGREFQSWIDKTNKKR